MAAGDGAGRLGDLTVLRHASLGRALGALLLTGGVLGAASTSAVAPVAQASEPGALCAEAAYLLVQFGTVGDPFAYSEGLGCLPGGDSFSNAVIDWGDGSTSAGTLGAVTPGQFASVQVAARHIYGQAGSFSIYVDVTDDQTGQVYRRGGHTAARIVAAGSPVAPHPPSPQPPPGTQGPAEAPGLQPRPPYARARHFAIHRDALRARVVALVLTSVPAKRLHAVIRWGDGTTSRGQVVGSGGELRVRGRHRWRRSGRYAVVVSLVEARGHVLVRTVGQATVTPPG